MPDLQIIQMQRLENIMEELLNKFSTYEKCMEFQNELVSKGYDWQTYWKDAYGRTIRESQYDDFIGTNENFVTIQFVDMMGSDGYSDLKHVFKFAVIVFIEDEFETTMHDSIEDAVKDYTEELKLIKERNDDLVRGE